jgi:transposase
MRSVFLDQAAGATLPRRRRALSAEEKRKIVAESSELGASMAEVVRRYKVNANLIFTWRRQGRNMPAAGGRWSG